MTKQFILSSSLLKEENIERIKESFNRIIADKNGFISEMIFEPLFVGIEIGTKTSNSVNIELIYADFKDNKKKYKSMTFQVTYNDEYEAISCEFISSNENSYDVTTSSFIISISNMYSVFKFLK